MTRYKILLNVDELHPEIVAQVSVICSDLSSVTLSAETTDLNYLDKNLWEVLGLTKEVITKPKMSVSELRRRAYLCAGGKK